MADGQRAKRIEVGTREVRNNFGELTNKAIFDGARVVVSRHGEPVVAIVSISDLERLEAVSDPFGRAREVVDDVQAVLDAHRKALS